MVGMVGNRIMMINTIDTITNGTLVHNPYIVSTMTENMTIL